MPLVTVLKIFAHRLAAHRSLRAAPSDQPLLILALVARWAIMPSPVARPAVASGAIDIEPLLAAPHHRPRRRQRERRGELAAGFAAIEMRRRPPVRRGRSCRARAGAWRGRRQTAGSPPAACTSAENPCRRRFRSRGVADLTSRVRAIHSGGSVAKATPPPRCQTVALREAAAGGRLEARLDARRAPAIPAAGAGRLVEFRDRRPRRR